MIDVQIVSRSANVPPPLELITWARAALARLDPEQAYADVCVRITDAEESSALNERYRSIAKPTNVLSFPAELPPGSGAAVLGDVVVCAEVVEAEAAAQGKALADHYAHMLVHGLLHLAGYDHETEAQASVMEALEVEILGTLEIADPYQSASGLAAGDQR